MPRLAPSGYVDLTPTWKAVLPVYIEGIRNGTDDARKASIEELTRMARLADLYVAEHKEP